jgi:hypothetical protein
MQESAKMWAAIGFGIFCVGGVARVYMDFAANGMNMFRKFQRGNTELGYWRLVKERNAPALPLFLSVVCIPVGILIVFGAITLVNKHGR